MNTTEPADITILVAIEDTKTQDFISLILMGEGYNVISYSSNETVLAHLTKEPVDLVISEFQSPNMDGLTLCKTIKNTLLYRHTPLILLVPDDELLLKTKSIFAGADDFIAKPFSSEELIARTRAALTRIYRYHDVNTVTKLPGMSTATRELQANIESLQEFAVAMTDLNNLKTFNDRYGFERGDQVLVMTSRIIRDALIIDHSPLAFLSHLGADDFLFISSCDKIDGICKKIIDMFQSSIMAMYDEPERLQGHILLTDGRGTNFEAPILRINLGVVTNEEYPFFSPAQVIQITTELKNHAQASGISSFSKERRASYPFT